MYRKTKIYSVDKQKFRLPQFTQIIERSGWYQQKESFFSSRSYSNLSEYAKQGALLQGVYVPSLTTFERRDVPILEHIQRVDSCCVSSYEAKDFQDISTALESAEEQGTGLLIIAIEEQYFES